MYRLTPAGKDLQAIVDSLGDWSMRWLPELGDEDLDPHLLLWDMRRQVSRTDLPPGRTVVHVQFDDVTPKSQRWWLILAEDDADVCDFDPGHDVTATVSTSLRVLTQIWRGDQSWQRAVVDGSVSIDGTSDARRAVPRWIGQSRLAAVPRPA